MKKKKSWSEKLNSSKPHEVKPVPRDMMGMKKGEMMLIPSPQIINNFIKSIPKGTSMDVKTLRKKLAKKHKAEVTCPITTGILLRIVAEAAYEAYEQGAKLSAVTPVWRVLDEDTPTMKKLSYDTAFILDQRAREGL